jgi:hypothetical protein
MYMEIEPKRLSIALPIVSFLFILFVFLVSTHSAGAADELVEVRLSQDPTGIGEVARRCFLKLREAGNDPARMPASEVGDCMRPEIEAMAEFAYEVSTTYSVSQLTRVALETCTIERTNAVIAKRQKSIAGRSEDLSWRWLADCLKEVRWLEHDEQANRLRQARREAERLEEAGAN